MVLCPGATESKFMAVATEKSEVAGANTDEHKGSMSFQTSEEVADECLRAFEKDRQYIISGRSNRMMYMITRHLPRSTVLNFVGNMFKKIIGK
jgi:short-subunit dehydrogenase